MDRLCWFQEQAEIIVFVSHDLDMPLRGSCKRPLLLNDGEVRAIGATGEVIDEYLTIVGRG